MRAGYDAALAQQGGSFTLWLALNNLTREGGLKQRDLAERMFLEEATITRHLDRFEQSSLIERRPDPQDRRVSRLFITPSGQACYAELEEVRQRFEHMLLEGLDEQELEVLIQALKHLQANLDAQP